ncbi:uncharacterized protein LOC141911727 isoform X3 [Tubulanus polymorphus]|uniref:uncharacterized protein LOC141911727 isoform X3 n=1 Tax=Tubulanus polymorphus TaxID=672921 RepID=UPI003DA38A6D
MIVYEMLGPVQFGVKRKLDDACLYDLPYHEQRQSILNISMCKLRTAPVKKVEPSLLRSVLIFNTLKFIEGELHREGISLSKANTPSLLPSIQSDALTLDPPPSGGQTQNNTVVVLRPESKLAVTEPTDQHATTATEKPSESSSNKDLLPLENSSTSNAIDINCNVSYSNGKNRWPASVWDYITNASNNNNTGGVGDFYSNECAPLSSPAAVERVDDLFGDVDSDPSVPDVTMYEDLFSPLTSKLTPLSADELMHAFPTNDAYSYANAGVNCRGDLLSDDLDHIMQVLIGI